MQRSLGIFIAAGVLLSVANPATAVTRFYANLTHDQEVSNPPVPEQGSSGIGFFELNDAMTALSYDIQLFGLDLDGLQTPGNMNDNVTRTHFHAAPAGSNLFGPRNQSFVDALSFCAHGPQRLLTGLLRADHGGVRTIS